MAAETFMPNYCNGNISFAAILDLISLLLYNVLSCILQNKKLFLIKICTLGLMWAKLLRLAAAKEIFPLQQSDMNVCAAVTSASLILCL